MSAASKRCLWLLPPWLAGAALRLWRVHDQVLGDDEYHALHAVLDLGFPELLYTYLPSDHCIPLSVLYRLWLVTFGPLTEMVLRAPVLASGLALLAVGPLWLERRAGRPIALVFAWLLAISPPLVLYSRIARSYMWMTLVGFLAAAAFWAWWRTGRARWGAAYALLAGFGLWVHLGSGPFLAAPWLWLVGAKSVDAWKGSVPAGRPGWGAILGVGLGTGLATLAFLGPAYETLVPLVAEKQGANVPMGWDTPRHLVQLVAGTGRGWVAVLFWLAAGGGWLSLWHRRPALATFTATLVAGHGVGLLLLSPLGLAHPIIFNRYLLITLPWILIWVAAAVAATGEGLARVGRDRARLLTRGLATGVVVVGLILAGPLARFAFWGGSFAHHNLFLLYSVEPPEPLPGTLPALYPSLAVEDEPGAVVEYPWFWVWNTNLTFPLAQRVHRRDVVVSMHLPEVFRRHVRFRNTSPAAPEAILESRGRYLILHKELLADELRIEVAGWMANSRRPAWVSFERLEDAARYTAQRLRREWGPPFHEDPSVAAWDLEAVRARIE